MENEDVFEAGPAGRLHAALAFSDPGAELLVQNGGARLQTVWIETVVSRPARRVRAARYDLEPGERLTLLFPLFEDEDPGGVTVRVRSRDRMLVLRRDAARAVPTKALARLGSAAIAAALLIFVAHASLAPGALTPVATVPAADDTVVEPVAAAKAVTASAPRVVLPPLVRTDPMRAAKPVAAVVIAKAPSGARSRAVTPPARGGAEPRITALQAPFEATSGNAIPISYRVVGSHIRIVATIGPTVVARRSPASKSGTVSISAPPSDRDGRVMTVRAYASADGRTATSETLVVLDRSE